MRMSMSMRMTMSIEHMDHCVHFQVWLWAMKRAIWAVDIFRFEHMNSLQVETICCCFVGSELAEVRFFIVVNWQMQVKIRSVCVLLL